MTGTNRISFVEAGPPRFSSVAEVRERLAAIGYLADDGIAGVVHLADRLAKPVLVEGPAGTGKTELAKSTAAALGSRLIRLQCYEGLDESKALYEWNYRKQLLRIQAQQVVSDGATPVAGSDLAGRSAWRALEDDIFTEEFLLTRPLLEAIRSPEPVVLLVDEVDRVELETEALLLEVLSEYQVSIPELGTVRASRIPLVFLTSNNTRELSEALKRRCLYLHLDYPTLERERSIVEARVPGITTELADQVARIVRSLRTLELKKPPSVSETLDWARTLVLLGVESIDAEGAKSTLHVLLKYRTDLERAAKDSTWETAAVPPTAPAAVPGDDPRHRLEGSSHVEPSEAGIVFAPKTVLDVLTGFVAELRAAGLPVSLTEAIDASEAVHHVPLEDRDALKYALGATLVKSSAHWHAFETAFEIYFSLRGPQYAIEETQNGRATESATEGAGSGGDLTAAGERSGGGGGQSISPEELAELLFRALLAGNDAQLAAAARYAVGRYAGMEPGRPVGGTYYLYRTLRNLDLDGLLERLVDAARSQSPEGVLTALEERLERDEAQVRLDQFRAMIEAEIRRRLVADRGSEPLARSLRKPLPEDVDFMHATREELVALRRAIHPLTRKLAVRLARKRRHGRRGPLDFRATVRSSLSAGGVPMEPKFRFPRPAKPEIFVVADISGSVASFARFTLHLVHAISSQFSKVRSFVFVDGIDEVTEFFEQADDVTEAIHRVNTEADVVWVDGHSDYGHAFRIFLERHGEEVTPRTTILLLGDARNNYHASEAWVLHELRHRARRLSWLNPEPRTYWGSGDSIIPEYAVHCDDVVECRNLRQLERFVAELA